MTNKVMCDIMKLTYMVDAKLISGRWHMLTQDMISDIVSGLLEIFETNILQIILYGSMAREENCMESDIDIAIILQHGLDKTIKERFIEWAANMDLKYEKVFSIVDIEKANLDKWGNVLPFYKNVCEEGITLWKAA